MADKNPPQKKQRNGRTIESLLDEAYECHKRGELAEAKLRYKKVVELSPKSDFALQALGAIYCQENKNKKAVVYIEKAIEINPSNAIYYANLSTSYFKLGKFKKSVDAAQKCIEIDDKMAAGYNTLGKSLQMLGRYEKSAEALKTAISLNPKYTEAYINLGDLFRAINKHNYAIKSYSHALSINPNNFVAQRSLANLLLECGQLAASYQIYHKIIQKMPNSPELNCEMGLVLRELLEHDKAFGYLKKAAELAPNNPYIQNNFGSVLRERGEAEAAIPYFEKAISLKKDYGLAWSNIAYSRRFTRKDRDSINEMKTLLEKRTTTHDDKVCLNYALGKIYDDINHWNKAFEHFQAANKLKGFSFNYEEFCKNIDAMEQYFTPELFEEKKNCSSDSKLPIFVVGMPRSGTSLIEQIIASHSRMNGAGELSDMRCMSEQLQHILQVKQSYPECISRLTPEIAKFQTDKYCERLEHISGGKAIRIVDKMPGNYLYLGLISLLFPKARVIHCQRHPLDVCLSCYFQNFIRDGLSFTTQLDYLGAYYQQYQRIMAFWDKVLPIKILNVNYEDVVNNPEEKAKEIVDFCGVKWDERCLEFNKNKRNVQTASTWQVRQPIYTSSIGRWKHYDKHIADLKRALNWQE